MLQLEMSFKKLYADDVLFQEMYQYMYDLGFCLIHISPGGLKMKKQANYFK